MNNAATTPVMSPLSAMPIGAIFGRGGRYYILIRRTGQNVVVGDQASGATLTMSADALGTVKRVPEVCFFADVPATRAS